MKRQAFLPLLAMALTLGSCSPVSAERSAAPGQASPATKRNPSETIMSRGIAGRFPGATLLEEVEFVAAIVGRVFRYRLLDSEIVVERPGEFFDEGGRYSTGHRAILHGTYAFDRGVVSIDCPDCRHTFLGLGWKRIFFRHQGRLLMGNTNGEGNVIELIPAS